MRAVRRPFTCLAKANGTPGEDSGAEVATWGPENYFLRGIGVTGLRETGQ